MSNEKKVWISFIDDADVKIYGVNINLPSLFNFKEYYNLKQTVRKIKETKIRDEVWRKEGGVVTQNLSKIRLDYYMYLPIAELPDSLWLEHKQLPGKRAYLFSILNGYLVMKKSCADIFNSFNLGQTTLTPLRLYDPKTQEPVNDEEYYFLNVSEKREFVSKEQNNPNIEFHYYDDEHWSYHFCTSQMRHEKECKKNKLEYSDFSIDITPDALDCELDLWRDDRLNDMSFFMSDRLRNALVKAKLDKLWNIQPCNLV